MIDRFTRSSARLGVLAVALAALLAGCAGAPPKPIGKPNRAAWQQRLAKLQTLSDWRLSGRIAVVNGSHGSSGSLVWFENAPRFEMRLAGPFGIGGFRLYGTANGLFIDTGDETRYTSDPAHFLARQLGGPLPVNSLRYWALGMPDPGSPTRQITVDQDGLLRHLEQNGWSIDYDRFTTTQHGWTLPTRLEAHRGQVKLKLVVEDWHVPAGTVILD
ncbi:MAG TPA: lipoprotein insertase outer membrane protein LolB [Gammaproteobacteria bacterium]|nr:lipoprotein insertase outer membrane protein LolB [Gammaproteobacteria bacterium]